MLHVQLNGFPDMHTPMSSPPSSRPARRRAPVLPFTGVSQRWAGSDVSRRGCLSSLVSADSHSVVLAPFAQAHCMRSTRVVTRGCICSFALLCGSTWDDVITTGLFILLQMDVWAVSGLGLRWSQVSMKLLLCLLVTVSVCSSWVQIQDTTATC